MTTRFAIRAFRLNRTGIADSGISPIHEFRFSVTLLEEGKWLTLWADKTILFSIVVKTVGCVKCGALAEIRSGQVGTNTVFFQTYDVLYRAVFSNF